MCKLPPAPLSRPALSADTVAERLRAHARLCQQVARECWSELLADELSRIGERCLETAKNIKEIEMEPCPLLQ